MNRSYFEVFGDFSWYNISLHGDKQKLNLQTPALASASAATAVVGILQSNVCTGASYCSLRQLEV